MIYDWLKNIVFVWPENFILMGLVPLLIWRYVKYGQWMAGAIMTSTVERDMPQTFKTKMRHLPFILRMIAIVCTITALARPQHQTEKSYAQGNGIDIVLCMDVSGSMGTQDVKPSRFEVAKEVAIDFVKNRPVDRIGLVIFAGEAFTKCPITPDKKVVLEQLQSLDILDGSHLENGTLIGEGLATSVNRIIKESSKSKVIILLTDGKEMAPPTRIIDPETAMEIAMADNVKVYCIGLGSATFTDEQMVKDIKGNTVRNEIDEGLLTKIANSTGGKYYRATDKMTLMAIYSQINQLEKSKVETINYKDTKEMFIPLVLAALLCLSLEIVLKFTVFRKFP